MSNFVFENLIDAVDAVCGVSGFVVIALFLIFAVQTIRALPKNLRKCVSYTLVAMLFYSLTRGSVAADVLLALYKCELVLDALVGDVSLISFAIFTVTLLVGTLLVWARPSSSRVIPFADGNDGYIATRKLIFGNFGFQTFSFLLE